MIPSVLQRCIGVLQIAALLAWGLEVAPESPAQAGQQGAQPYTFLSTVHEVEVAFHAVGKGGLPVNDLKSDEIEVLDDGVQVKILSFYAPQDRPIHAGILIDTSESMEKSLVKNRAIATQFVQRVLRRQKDQAFVEDFGYTARVTQAWSGDPARVISAIRNSNRAGENSLGGTALFQTLFQACYSEFGKPDEVNAKFILLFTDGEDNASHTDLEDTAQMCQQSNTAIYAFRPEMDPGYSGGPRNLAELTRQTGGRLFRADDAEAEMKNDLATIERDLRNQYFLSFHASKLKHDGSFHRLELKGPERVDRIEGRSGYYDRKLTQAEVRPDGFVL